MSSIKTTFKEMVPHPFTLSSVGSAVEYEAGDAGSFVNIIASIIGLSTSIGGIAYAIGPSTLATVVCIIICFLYTCYAFVVGISSTKCYAIYPSKTLQIIALFFGGPAIVIAWVVMYFFILLISVRKWYWSE